MKPINFCEINKKKVGKISINKFLFLIPIILLSLIIFFDFSTLNKKLQTQNTMYSNYTYEDLEILQNENTSLSLKNEVLINQKTLLDQLDLIKHKENQTIDILENLDSINQENYFINEINYTNSNLILKGYSTNQDNINRLISELNNYYEYNLKLIKIEQSNDYYTFEIHEVNQDV